MARTIAVGPAPPSRGSVIGEALGQGLGLEFARRQAEQRELEQAIEALNPIRLGITSESPMARAAGVAADTLPGAQQFAAGADTPDLQGMQQQLSAQQTPQQRILQRLAADPERFARAFGGADTGELLALIQEIQSPEQAEFGFENVPGVGLVRTDPRRGTAETVVERPPEAVTPGTAIGRLRQDLQEGLITREEFTAQRRNLLTSDEPVVEVADPGSSTGSRFIPRSQAAGREAPEPGTLVDLSGLSEREQVQALSKRRNEIQNRKGAAVRVARLSNRLREQLQQGGAQDIGVVGTLVRFGNSVSEQAKAAAQTAGVDFDPQSFDFSAFPEEARRSAGVRSNVLSLAFALANARESGRLTDQDVQRALDTIGASSGSVAQLQGALDEAVVDAIRTIDDVIAIEQSNFEGSRITPPTRLAEDLERIGIRLPEAVQRRLRGRGAEQAGGAAQAARPQARTRALPDFETAPIEAVQQFAEQASEAELDALPEEQRQVIVERLRGGE